jgi:seryl-tRNA(Sec) selenium transferase
MDRCVFIIQARMNGSPNEESICRGMKIAKEDVVAFVAALRALLEAEGEQGGGQMAGYEAAVERMRAAFSSVAGVVAARRVYIQQQQCAFLFRNR